MSNKVFAAIVGILVTFLVFMVIGLAKESKKSAVEKVKIVKLCEDAGGIPVYSTWDGRFQDCIIIPVK